MVAPSEADDRHELAVEPGEAPTFSRATSQANTTSRASVMRLKSIDEEGAASLTP